MPTPDPAPSHSSRSSETGEWVVVHERNPWLRRLAVGTLVLAVAAGILFWKRAALRNFSNEWNADRHLAHAERELAAGNHRVALSRALTAIELEPRRIAPLRVISAAAEEIRDSRLLVYATALAGHPEATDADRIAALGVFAEVGDARRFAAVFDVLPDAFRASPEARLLRLRQRLRRGGGAGVVAALEVNPILLETWPGPLLRLEGLWQRADPGDNAAAGGLAAELLQQDLEPGNRNLVVEALSRLPSSRIPPEAATILLAALGEEIGPDEPVTLRDTLAIAADPGARDSIVASVVARLGSNTPGLLCRWLASIGNAVTILEVTEDEHTLSDPVVYEARARALIETKKFEEALTLLRYPPVAADPVEIAILEAAAARALDRTIDESAAWRKARLAAESDLTRNRHLGLAKAAIQAGRKEVAVDATVAACRHPTGLLPPAREIRWVMTELVEANRPEDLLAVLERILPWEAFDPALINNAIYLSLVLEQQVSPAAVEVLEKIVTEHPDQGAYRNTLALAYLGQGDSEPALSLYRERVSNAPGFWKELSDSARSVFALTLAETGDVEGSLEVYETIQWDSMLDREREFFQERIARHFDVQK